jgi:hypothetical protein
MPFPITAAVHVHRDKQGRIRQLEHGEQPFILSTIESGAAEAAEAGSLKSISDAYLRTVIGSRSELDYEIAPRCRIPPHPNPPQPRPKALSSHLQTHHQLQPLLPCQK